MVTLLALPDVLGYVGQFLKTFQEFPPCQKAASFTIDQVLQKLPGGAGSR